MHTKERISASVRVLCFVILIAATAIRMGGEFYKKQPAAALTPSQEPYPTMMYEPYEDKLLFPGEETVIKNDSGAKIDLEKLREKRHAFLLSREPQILIVHTHATEAYCGTANARSENISENVVHIGDVLSKTLCENGINTLHDETLIDADGYYDAYARAATLIEEYLQKYPSIRMVIDVHRDSVSSESGQELPLSTEIDGQSAAQLMLVMGTDRGGHYHPNWEENLAFAVKLQDFCEAKMPGVFRNLVLRAQRYNQHLTPQSILLEVGTAGNTLQEAEISVQFFGGQLAEFLQTQP